MYVYTYIYRERENIYNRKQHKQMKITKTQNKERTTNCKYNLQL